MRMLEFRPRPKRDPVDAEDRAYPLESPSSQAKSPEPTPPSDNASTLGKIVETQHQIQFRRLEFESALKLVAERVCEMTNATGAAVGIIEYKTVRYRAVAGRGAPSSGSIVPLNKAIFAPCLNTRDVFHCPDASAELLLDADECKRRGIQSLIAVPVFHDGGIAGGLELYYATRSAFTEQNVHTCQLMAGLVAEALAREEEVAWKKSLARERTAMLEASGETAAESGGTGRKTRREESFDCGTTADFSPALLVPEMRASAYARRAVLRSMRHAPRRRLRTSQHAEQGRFALAVAGIAEESGRV